MHNSVLAICMLILSVDDVFSDGNSAHATDTIEETKQGERAAKDGVYIGCFAQGCLHFDYVVNISRSITPDSCTAACEAKRFPYALIYNRTKCSCSCTHICKNSPLDNGRCGLPCRGDLTLFCGGFEGASVYAVDAHSSMRTTDKCYQSPNEKEVFAATLGDICNQTKEDKHAIIVAIIGCMVHRRHRHRRLGRQPTTSPPEANQVKEVLSDTSDTNETLDRFTRESVLHVYAEADQCFFSTQATRNKFQRNSDPDPSQEGSDETMDAVQGNKGYHGYVDMHSKGNRSRGDKTVRDSMTDGDGYVIQD